MMTNCIMCLPCAIREAGLSVPEDISVTGFGNREVSAYAYPKLTTTEIDLKAIGLVTAEMAIQKLGKAGKFANEQNVVIPSKLILRDTVKKL